MPARAAASLAFLVSKPAIAASPAGGAAAATVTETRWCGDAPEACAEQRVERWKRWQAMSSEERKARRSNARAKWETMPEADKALLLTHMEQRLASMPEQCAHAFSRA